MHFLNNQLHPILDEEEEDPKMLVEDDGWEEEEVELEDKDDAISTSTVSTLKIRVA